MPGVVLHKGPAVNDQHSFGPTLQKAGKFLGIHHFVWKFVTGHGRLVPSAASGRRKGTPREEKPAQVSQKWRGKGKGNLRTINFCHAAKALYDKPSCQTC
ncbi:hypothetical protein L345_07309, partial [Ophiophagus hannah]